MSSKSPIKTDHHNKLQENKSVIENHQTEERTIPSVLLPNEDGLNEKNLRPVITQVTPVHSPNRPTSPHSGSILSPTPTSELDESGVKNEKLLLKRGESADATDDEDDDEDEDDVREMEGRTVTAKGQTVIKYFWP